ncbi:hypothetical protein SKTS_08600 [Sulfurimicrobium lacus]|uniref:GGDEF domain-containing protein n=1 Tax=Sulfurimicrobium lacus TaxID=2715678 RepID=A0A6F8V8I7_9PROT|nr:EAL domain-containing protein [Sulfurimicrobium lacus]BCB25974.1 hypothetical protein SKTS_08600 [Sulfurimicrobium lacus]
MGRTAQVKRDSIARQAAVRLIFSLGLFVALIAVSTAQIYKTALSKAAEERASDLAAFYQSRLAQLEHDWELQSRDFKVRIETTRILESPESAVVNLQAFMTVQGTNRRFQHLVIEDRQRAPVFIYGSELDLVTVPLQKAESAGWYRHPSTGDLYRIFSGPIWLGDAGMGRFAVFYRLDNALLQQLSTPGVTLAALYNTIPVANSTGQRGLEQSVVQPLVSDDVERREVPWSGARGDATVLRIDAPVKALFSRTELALGVSVIPVFDGFILWLTLGTWLMRQARRIRDLGGAVEEFSQQRGVTDRLQQWIHSAKAGHSDEIHQVGQAFENMVQQTVERDEERLQEEAQRRLAAMVFANSSEAILISDRHNLILAVNRAFTELTGYAEAEVLGQDPRMLSAGKESPAFYHQMWAELMEGGHWSGEVHDRRKDGTIYLKWLSIAVVRDADGAITNYVGAFTDITERKEAEQRVLHLATHDTLTGLPNRKLLLDRLGSAITLSIREQRHVGLLFLDLDNFKWVNDSLGHASGDKLLIAIGERLQGVIRTSDTVARLGGDEFVVLLMHPDSLNDVSHVAQKIIDAVAQPLDLNGTDFHVTTSMGICVFPNDGDNPETLLQHADTAMYAAKAAGRNQFRYFDTAMNQKVLERIQLEQDLRQALQRSEFEVYYQPKLCASTNDFCGAEALIRWNHPVHGLVSPAKFIPLAEENGIIIPLGEWIIRSVCEQIGRWRRGLVPTRKIAINLSALQLESDTFVASVDAILKETGTPTSLIEFELTESMVLRSPDRSVNTLTQFQAMGITLALDDFGTGYSSLSYLKRLPVNTLKIDRSFVEGLPHAKDDAQIVQMIIALAKSIRLEVVAEGIETEEQMAFLKRLGCDLLQGYLIAKPMPAAAYESLLQARTAGGCDCAVKCSLYPASDQTQA